MKPSGDAATYSAPTGSATTATTELTKPIPPSIGGYLSKLKHKPNILQTWNKRYFRVNPRTETFEYFSTYEDAHSETPQDKKEPKRTFFLSSEMTIEKVNNFIFQIIFHGSPGNTPVVFYLKADSKADMGKWVDALETYLADLEAYTTWKTINSPAEKPVPGAKEGPLMKLKHVPNLLGSWNSRYCKINPETCSLDYYSSAPTTAQATPKKSFVFSNVMSVRQMDQWSFQLVFAKEQNGSSSSSNNSSLRNRSVRYTGPPKGSEIDSIIVLRAESMAEQKEWMEVLMRYMEKRRVYEEHLAKVTAAMEDGPMRPSVAATDVPDWLRADYSAPPAPASASYLRRDTVQTAVMAPEPPSAAATALPAHAADGGGGNERVHDSVDLTMTEPNVVLPQSASATASSADEK